MNENTTSRRRWRSVLFKALNTFGIAVLVLINVLVLCMGSRSARSLSSWGRVDFSPYAADFRTVERCLHRMYGNNVDEPVVIYTKKDGTVWKYVKAGENKRLDLSEDELQAFRGCFRYSSPGYTRGHLHRHIDCGSDRACRMLFGIRHCRSFPQKETACRGCIRSIGRISAEI